MKGRCGRRGAAVIKLRVNINSGQRLRIKRIDVSSQKDK